jgi:hypothetical protein
MTTLPASMYSGLIMCPSENAVAQSSAHRLNVLELFQMVDSEDADRCWKIKTECVSKPTTTRQAAALLRRVPEAEGGIERRQRYTEEQSSLQDGKQSHLMANAIRRGIAQRIIGLPDPVPRSVEPAVRCSRCMVRMSSSRSACTRASTLFWMGPDGGQGRS